jgi:hypothetical protein
VAVVKPIMSGAHIRKDLAGNWRHEWDKIFGIGSADKRVHVAR